ncbi:MAG TPA: VWA domain-containing protein [Candidatus Angelobacter sp.]|nr:VWA domain-containing protein [Candidatus Angelobacter sp.]
MRLLIFSAKIFLSVATLSLLASGQQNPCDLSRVEPPATDPEVQKQRDIEAAGRSAQLDCVQKELNKTANELGAKRAAERAEFKAQFESLKIYADALLQLATDFKDYVDQSSSTELSAIQIKNLQQMVMMSHSIRETIAGYHLADVGASAKAKSRQKLVQNAALCLRLATTLKHSMDGYLEQNNQNTVSAVELKDKSVSSTIVKTAEQLEALTVELRESALTTSSNSKPTDRDVTSQKISGQELSQNRTPDSSLVLRANTRMVLVDTIVTDSDGKPVTNLKAEDFTIIENGKKQTISAFGMRSRLHDGQKSSPARRLSQGFFTNIPDFHSEDGPPTIILADFLNTLPADQMYMRDALLRYLQTGPKRNMCIYALGRRLRLLQDFTDDTQLLIQAVTKPSTQPYSVNEDPNFKTGDMSVRTLSTINDSTGSISGLLAEIKVLQTEVGNFDFDYRFRATMTALERIAYNSTGYPERKNLIWISATFPLSNDNLKQRSYYEDFHKTASRLTDAQIAVYPVDPQGLTANGLPDASTGPGGPVGPRADTQLVNQLSSADTNLQFLHFTMNHIAGWTGGRAYYGQNNIDGTIGAAIEDGGSYYALGFYPTNKKWNGQFRKIEVKVARNGLRVRHRDGYFAIDNTHHKQAEQQAARREFLFALGFESPAATSLPFVAQVLPPSKEERAVTVDFGVDPHALVFDSHPDKLQHAHLDFAVVAFDAWGNQVSSQFDIVTTHLSPERYAAIMSGRLGFRQKITLPPGRYLLKIGVRDIKSDVMGTVTAKVEVPPSS